MSDNIENLTECYTCLDAGDHTPAAVTAEVEDAGNGWQTWHYCQECADALGICDGDEIAIGDDDEDDDEDDDPTD